MKPKTSWGYGQGQGPLLTGLVARKHPLVSLLDAAWLARLGKVVKGLSGVPTTSVHIQLAWDLNVPTWAVAVHGM